MNVYNHFERYEFFGEFFTNKDNYSVRFPARVIYSPENGLILEYLTSELKVQMHHPYLHGILSTGDVCTLFGPFDFSISNTTSNGVLFTKSGRHEFQHFVIGAYIYPESVFNGCNFVISGMQEFFYAQGFMSKLAYSEKPSLTMELPDALLHVTHSASFSYVDGHLINLIHSREKVALTELSAAFESIKERHKNAFFSLRDAMMFSFFLESTSGKSISELTLLIYNVSSLFSMLMNQPAFPEEISITLELDGHNVRQMNILTGLCLEPRTVDMAKSKKNHRFMPINNSKVSLDVIVPRWLDNIDKFKVISTIFQYETGFSTLSSVYGLIILLCTHIEDINDHVGFKEKTKKYINPIKHYGSDKLIKCLSNIFKSSVDDIGKNIAKLRNELAHADGSKTLMNKLDLDEYIVIVELLKLIVATHIFNLLGINLEIAHSYQDSFLPYIEEK